MIEPYINIGGRAEEAIDFYDSVFHCKSKQIFHLGDMPENPEQPLPDDMRNLVGDSEIEIYGSIVHVSDMMGDFMTQDGHISLMIQFESPEALTTVYDALAKEGQVLMPLAEESFAKLYAWVKDKFGVGWQLMFN